MERGRLAEYECDGYKPSPIHPCTHPKKEEKSQKMCSELFYLS